MIDFNWKWKTAIIVFMIYVSIARYCDFKEAVGLPINNCSCKLK